MLVATYQITHNVLTGKGNLHLADGLGGNETVSLDGKPCDERKYILDILRNEGPVYYVPATGDLTTLQEPVGEGE